MTTTTAKMTTTTFSLCLPSLSSRDHFITPNRSSKEKSPVLQAGCPSCRPTNSVKALKVFRQFSRRMFIAVCLELFRLFWQQKHAHKLNDATALRAVLRKFSYLSVQRRGYTDTISKLTHLLQQQASCCSNAETVWNKHDGVLFRGWR